MFFLSSQNHNIISFEMDIIELSIEQKVLSFCCVFIIVILIAIGVVLYYHSESDARQRDKAQRKCKEYMDLACSLSPPGHKSSDKIVGGDRVPEGMLPHQVFIVTILRELGVPVDVTQCGGTLINEKFILTAAHCTHNILLDDLRVLVGKIILDPAETTLKKVKKMHIHPNYVYSITTFEADICLLELEENVIFSSNVRPICLNTKFKGYHDSMIASGWGKTEPGPVANASVYLKMVELHYDNEVEQICRLTFTISYNTPRKTAICLAHRTQGVHLGDSGGPLQVRLKNSCDNTWEQIGIVSVVGLNFYTDGKLTIQIFNKVEYYLPWIASVAWPD